jgi:hypothetical protein
VSRRCGARACSSPRSLMKQPDDLQYTRPPP